MRVAALPVNVRNDIRRRADASGDRADGCGDSTRGLGGFSLPSERLLGNEEAGDAGEHAVPPCGCTDSMAVRTWSRSSSSELRGKLSRSWRDRVVSDVSCGCRRGGALALMSLSNQPAGPHGAFSSPVFSCTEKSSSAIVPRHTVPEVVLTGTSKYRYSGYRALNFGHGARTSTAQCSPRVTLRSRFNGMIAWMARAMG